MSEDEDYEHDDEDEVEDPADVFVGMAFDRDESDEVFRTIARACKGFEMKAWRAHPSQIHGSLTINEAIEGLVDKCDFAVIDLTHERPSVAHEIGYCDAVFERDFILLIAKRGTPVFANIQGRMVNYYDDVVKLKRIVENQLKMMIETWYGDEDGDDDLEEEEDEDQED